MKRTKYLNSRFLSLILLGLVVSSYFLIKSDEVIIADVQADKSSLPISKKIIQSPPEFPARNKSNNKSNNRSNNRGKILSLQNGGGYSFIEVELPSKKILSLASANVPNKLLVGTDVYWENPRLAKNYYSHALNKNFERLYMVTIKDDPINYGVVTSVKTVDENTLLSIQQEHSTREVIVKSTNILSELFVGSKIEWQQKNISSHKNEDPNNNKQLQRSPIVVDWVRNSKN
jgi:hypothetical protein